MSSRRVPASASLRPPLQLDETRTIAGVAVPPVVARGSLLVSAQDGDLLAFDEQTGERRWSLSLGGPPEKLQPHAGSPLVVDDRIYVRSRGDLISIDLLTGDIIQRHPAPALDLHDGASLDGCVVSYVAPGRLEAWDLATVERRWSIERRFEPVPIAGEGTMAAVAGPDWVTSFDVGDGHELWTASLDGDAAIDALAIAPDGSVLAALSQRVISLDAATGSIRWDTPVSVARAGTMAVTDDGEVHVVDLVRYQRLSMATGAVLFSQDFDRRAMPAVRGSLGRLAVSRSHVFGGDQRGPMIAVSRTNGSVDWTWPESRRRAASAAPVLSDSRLYALAVDGTLQCFVQTG